jgi:large subunit ribosomal protein L21
MSIVFLASGKQYRYIPSNRKSQTFHIDYQKSMKAGDKIVFDKILSKGEEFGQPFIKDAKLIGEVVKHGLKKKINILKYKAKKRYKKKMGFRQQYTEVKITSAE